ncbi:hypothetical protein QUH41_27545, partial [Klebsiella grimontii]|nr:hypothetical protein [Klebsiella grimontii]
AAHTQQSPAPLAIRPADPLKYADAADGEALENEWRAMTDVHQRLGGGPRALQGAGANVNLPVRRTARCQQTELAIARAFIAP